MSLQSLAGRLLGGDSQLSVVQEAAPAAPSRFSPPSFATPAAATQPGERPLAVPPTIEQPAVGLAGTEQQRTGRVVTAPLGNEPAAENPAGAQIPPQLVHALYGRIMAGLRTDVQLERTPKVEQMLAGRFMEAMQEIKAAIPDQTLPGEEGALLQAVMDEILGYGPLESLLKDDSVSEIMVNGP